MDATAGDRTKFVEVLRRFDTAMLVTYAKDGGLRSRPMALAEIEDDGTTWFVTGADTAKTDEIGPALQHLAQWNHIAVDLDGATNITAAGMGQLKNGK